MSMGRKALISAVMVVISVAVVFFKGDVPPGLADMFKFILGSFIVGNVAASATYQYADAVKTKANKGAEPASVVLAPELAQALGSALETIMQNTNEVKSNQEQLAGTVATLVSRVVR